jgi:septum formation protein
MLDAAGVEYRAVPSKLDEAAIKAGLVDPVEIAGKLAAAKARDVRAAHPEQMVIGSDSVVSVEGRCFDKPRSREEAADHLRFFSGKTMTLTSAVALISAGKASLTYVDQAVLHVRPLSARFIDTYLDAEWPEVGYCVGVFRLEGRGVQLFDRIDGNYFTILGMPLIPLLGALREHGLMPA